MEDECPICLIDMKDEIKTILKCKHTFHYECFQKMLEKFKNCPMCRDEIKLKNNKIYLKDEKNNLQILFEYVVKLWFAILICLNIYTFSFLIYEFFKFLLLG